MRKRHITKLGFIFIALIFSLASISVSYSGWTGNIQINGSVTTADDFNTLMGTSNTAWARMNNDSNDFTYQYPGHNWATYLICMPTETVQTFYLYAGQHYWVGELHVWKDSNYLYVSYNLSKNYYSMSESHLHVATSVDGIPHSNGGPIPGHFSYSNTYDPTISGGTYKIAWDTAWNNLNLYIAAHAVVWGIYS